MLTKTSFGTEMGIKFYCPNGHKLNVKSFLSGKRAICPKCGARFVVPKIEGSAAAEDETASTGAESLDAVAVKSEFESSAAGADQSPASGPAIVTPPDPPTTSAADAISEAPDAIWYVRPATGGQFGPASGDMMRGWVSEGRVSASSLVWRAGWSEWQAGATVFPQLGGLLSLPGVPPPIGQPVAQTPSGGTTVANGPPPIGGSPPVGHVVQSTATESTQPVGPSTDELPLSQSVRRQRRQKDARLYATAVLVVTTVILLIVLVVVFRRQSQPVEAPTQEPDPSAEVSIE